MAEVLSQSQIDALLAAAQSGGLDEGPKKEESTEKKYKKYDFFSPRKFSKDRLKILNSIYENYTRVINSRLNAMFHSTCEIEVGSIEELHYYEFSNALREGDVLALAKIDREDLQEEYTPVLLTMMDRMMGGEGEPDDNLDPDYKLTDLELNMYADIIKDMLDFLGRSWENYITLKFSYVRTETNPTLVQLIGYDDTVVIVGLDIRFPNSSGRLSMCLPGEMLTNIFTEISKQTGHRSTGEDKSEEIFDSLRDSDLEIIAELARTKLQLSDIYHLNVGDVVDIKQPKDAPIFLNISGRRWFDGRMGIYNKQMAVKIGETYIKA